MLHEVKFTNKAKDKHKVSLMNRSSLITARIQHKFVLSLIVHVLFAVVSCNKALGTNTLSDTGGPDVVCVTE